MRRASLAAALSALLLLAVPALAHAAFGFLPGEAGFSIAASTPDGSPASEAGAHPYALTTNVELNRQGGFSDGDLRTLRIDLPPGLAENPGTVERCNAAQFATPRDSPFQASASGESCPLRSQIGILTVRGPFPGGERTFGLFNLTPPPGFLALIGASPFGAPVTFAERVRDADGRFGLSLEARDVTQRLDLTGMTLTVWGNPWLVGHDPQRGDCLNEADPSSGFGSAAQLDPEPPPEHSTYQPGTCSTGNPQFFAPLAYLTLPTSCAAPVAQATATSWQGATAGASFQMGALGGCQPRFQDVRAQARPLAERAASPSGLDFDLTVNQENLVKNVTATGRLIPAVVAASQVQRAVVRLPQGMTVNPSVAAGLGVCTPAQYAAESVPSAPGAGCPENSRIGEVTVESPLSPAPFGGGLYLAQPRQNPFGALLALYVVAKDPERDLLVKLAGKVDADHSSGRLTTTFDRLPELPYTHLNVHFRETQRAPLATPLGCGAYATETEITPWLDPGASFAGIAGFELASGIGGGPCPPAVAPFAPGGAGATYNRNAGSYTPFYLHLTRGDAEQEITGYSARLAPGLLGKIAGVPFCPEAAIAAAARNGGFAETDNPSCPRASRIGHTSSGYGLGSVLAYAPGNLYLAGPYHGAPLSVVAVDSATVGPFDLGVIVIRSAVRIDPVTAQVYLDAAGSDPIPHILEGIPLHLRDVRVYIDRPGFMLNPTSCERFAVSSRMSGSGAAFSNPADDTTAVVDSPFQVSFCSSLAFRPSLDLRLRGPTKRGRFPALTATVTPRPGQANIGKATVLLPPALLIAPQHIRKICSRADYAAERCPPATVYGTARALTPLLDQPLEGPVYLRSSSQKLPELVASLSGGGVHVDVAGRIDSKGGGMRATYDVLPDAPVTSFALTLTGGRHGLLLNSVGVCQARPASARLVGQNNVATTLHPRLLNPRCGPQRRHGTHQ